MTQPLTLHRGDHTGAPRTRADPNAPTRHMEGCATAMRRGAWQATNSAPTPFFLKSHGSPAEPPSSPRTGGNIVSHMAFRLAGIETCAVTHPCLNPMVCIDQLLQRRNTTKRKPGATRVLLKGKASPTQPLHHGLHQRKDLPQPSAIVIYCVCMCRLTS